MNGEGREGGMDGQKDRLTDTHSEGLAGLGVAVKVVVGSSVLTVEAMVWGLYATTGTRMCSLLVRNIIHIFDIWHYF